MEFKLQTQVKLAELTTLRIGGVARYFTEVDDSKQFTNIFEWLQQKSLPYFVLSGGSNTVFADGEFSGLVIKIAIKGIETVKEDRQYVWIKAGAGETWDDVVDKSATMNLNGIEALSAIPGLAGTAPVQNIGAYGQEIKDVLQAVEVFDIKTLQTTQLTNAQCGFGYRDSIFKTGQKGRYIITHIVLKLSKVFDSLPNYPDIEHYFAVHPQIKPSTQSIRTAVIQIRSQKLPNPTTTPNAGSFFKNPIVPAQDFSQLQATYPSIKAFPHSQSEYKISAGWLIENCNLKGYKKGPVRVDPKHALVLENVGGANQKELLELVDVIQKAVQTKFGIHLDPEPEIVNFS